MHLVTIVRQVSVGVALLSSIGLCLAAAIQYSLTSVGSNVWRYEYTLNNTGPILSFDEFTIFFELPGVISIDSFVVPVGWDPLIIQPDSGLPASGFVDALRTAGPVPASSFSGFSADFHYAPGLMPAAQMFELLLSTNFDAVIKDVTTPLVIVTAVPEPGTSALMLSGLGVLAWAARRKAAVGGNRDRVVEAEGTST